MERRAGGGGGIAGKGDKGKTRKRVIAPQYAMKNIKMQQLIVKKKSFELNCSTFSLSGQLWFD